MQAKQFLLFAEELLKGPAIHPAMRSAVSRGYYAAHHIAKEFVQSAGVTINRHGDAHKDVCRHLEDIKDSELEEVGTRLDALRSDRNEADYELGKTRFEGLPNATDRVGEARELMELIEKCLLDAARLAKVKRAIQKRHKILRGL